MVDPARQAARFLARVREEQAHHDAARRAVRAGVNAAIRELAARSRLTRVALFGSVAWGGFVPERSDVDVMVWGLDDAEAVDLATELWARLERPVHVVRAETADPALVDRVLRDGERVHGG